MTFNHLDFKFVIFRHVDFYTTKVIVFHDSLRFQMFFLEMGQKRAMFFVVVYFFSIFAHPTIGGTPSQRAKEI